MSCMFRLVELSGGKISIDGVDISQLGLMDLRSKIASKDPFISAAVMSLTFTVHSYPTRSATVFWDHANQSGPFQFTRRCHA